MRRTFSFVRITGKIKVRTDIEEKLAKANVKEYVRRLNPFWKIWHYVYLHKKKNIFFTSLLGLAYYYNLHLKTYRWFTVQTPLQRIQRAIMKRKLNPNARFCIEPETSLKPNISSSLVDFFLDSDQKLEFGLPRAVLVDISLELDWAKDNDKFLGAFLWESGYRKTSKERHSSMRLDQFLGFFEKMRDKNQLDEDEMLRMFLEKAPAQIQVSKEREKRKKEKKKAKEEEVENKMKKAFSDALVKERTELDQVEEDIESLHQDFNALFEKQKKTSADAKKMKEIEEKIRNKERHRSKIYG